MTALVLREMSTTHGRSPGGYLWAVLEPVAGITLLSLIFSVAFRSPAIGISFPLFYATGMLPFLMFSNVVTRAAQALNFSKNLLAYPTITFVDAIVARVLLCVITQLMVNYVVFGGILLFFETRARLELPIIGLSLTLAALLGLGIGTLNCYLFSRIQFWQQVWSIIMRPMFIISCIFLLFESIPQPYRDWLWYNPLVHIVGLMRKGFYPSYDASYVSLTYVLIVAAVSFLTGLILLRRDYHDLLDR
ncbi:MAG: ABC transporter permease [Pseudomonadota bacterium]